MTDKSEKSTRYYSRYLKQGGLALFLLVIVFGGWAALGKIQGAVMATGQVIVQGKPKVIQHLDGGIVGEILVRDGDNVAAGDVLMRLKPTSLAANRDLVRNRYFEAQALTARLIAERDGLSEIAWPEDIRDGTDAIIVSARTGQQNLFDTRKTLMDNQTTQLRERIQQSQNQIRGLRSLIESKRSQLGFVEEELTGLRTLQQKGYATKPRILALERERSRITGDVASNQADIARLQSGMGEIRLQILQLERDQTTEVLEQLRNAESVLSDTKEQLTTAADQLGRVDIISPVSGLVHDMAITTVGGVVTPGNPIMQIIPNEERMIVEAQVEPGGIDQVYIGQTATVRFSAFNARTTPELNGNVIGLSPNVLQNPITGIPYYAVKVEVPEDELARLKDQILVPGMPADVFLQTERRSVLSYIVKPLSDQMSRTFREE